MSDYETLRFMLRGGGKFPAIIGQNRFGKFGFFTGAIPTELEGKKYKTTGEAVHAFIGSEAAKQGAITAFQVEENGHISRPYRKAENGVWTLQA